MDNDSNTPPAREKWELARRDFLIMGSVALAGAAASTVRAGTITALATPAPGSILSVGYAERMAAGARLVSAETIRGADRRFLETGARVTVHGISQPAETRDVPVSIRFSLFFPHATEEGRLPFLAFASSFDAKGRRNTSGRLSFVAPLDHAGMLPVGVERLDLSAPILRLSRMLPRMSAQPTGSAQPAGMDGLQKGGSLCRLSSGDAGDIRLRPGTYFIALRQSSHDRVPNWNALAIGDHALDLRNGIRPADFEYVALSVDHAKA